MVCIIDDREDVWSHASNLIHVKPYHFFQHTGDINAPPGLDKHENDNQAGVDLTKIKEKAVLSAEQIKDQEIQITNGVVEENGAKEKKEVEENLKVNGAQCKINEKTVSLTAEDKAKISINDKKSDQKSNLIDAQDKKESSDNGKLSSLDILDQVSKKNLNQKSDVDKADSVPVEPNKTKSSEASTDVEMVEVPQAKINKEVTEKPTPEDSLIEIEDPDDYLVYLEIILKRIHKEFFDQYDKMESGGIPDLKKVIPLVRCNILKGCKLVFSGLVPTHIKLEQSKAYQVARSLGAVVTQDIEDDTTHLVAVRPGTAKVNAGRRKKNLKIVTPDWLWCCAERWEHVDERIFPLNSKGSKNRHPPPHCSSPDHVTTYPEHNTPALRKRTPSGRFMDTINPLMSFSSADIADMDKEVEDILYDESDSSEEGELPKECQIVNNSSSSDEESLTGEYPKGHKRKRQEDEDNLLEDSNSTEDESPSIKFRRGESVDDLLDMDKDDTQDSEGSIDPPDEVDDGEWNMMGAALEREFLSNN